MFVLVFGWRLELSIVNLALMIWLFIFIKISHFIMLFKLISIFAHLIQYPFLMRNELAFIILLKCEILKYFIMLEDELFIESMSIFILQYDIFKLIYLLSRLTIHLMIAMLLDLFCLKLF